jgi:5-enolpyruvylshikimate-3-phosphate synthase
MRKVKYRISKDVDTDDILEAIATEKQRIMENINDRRADAKKERKITLQIHFKPNPDSGSVTVGADINSSLAPLAIASLADAVTQISFDEIDEETEELRA